MPTEYTELNHGKILKVLKDDRNVLRLIYGGSSDLVWDNKSIENAIKDSTDLILNYSDDILMKRLRDFFNVDISYGVN